MTLAQGMVYLRSRVHQSQFNMKKKIYSALIGSTLLLSAVILSVIMISLADIIHEDSSPDTEQGNFAQLER